MSSALSATIFRAEIDTLRQHVLLLSERIAKQRIVADAERDPLDRASLFAELEQVESVRRRGELALDLLDGSAYTGLGEKAYPKPCAVCLGIVKESEL